MKIYSILLNPTIDEILEIENFQVGGTFKVKKSITYPVGKAISFSLGIRELDANRNFLKVITLIGKQEKSLYSNFLNNKKIEFEYIEVNDKTRSNKTINDPIRGTTTHIREKGFKVPEEKIKKLKDLLQNHIKQGDFCIFSGSIPPGVDNDIYYEMINTCKNKGAITILDTNGPALLIGVKANPHIIKPNLFELSQILNEPKLNELKFSDNIQTSREIVKKAKVLLNKDLEVVLITLGDKGAICLTNETVIYGNVQIDEAVDTVGSGDSFLAGFILGYFQKKDLTECFKLAIACGAANTLIPGPGVFEKKSVETLIEKVQIKKIN